MYLRQVSGNELASLNDSNVSGPPFGEVWLHGCENIFMPLAALRRAVRYDELSLCARSDHSPAR
jgi:hypothetical protein